MKRLAYFGTNMRPGHYFLPIRGSFTTQEEKQLESIDLLFEHSQCNFKFFKFEGYGCLGFPASPDDMRAGSKTIFFVEGAETKSEILNALEETAFVSKQFQKLSNMYRVPIPCL